MLPEETRDLSEPIEVEGSANRDDEQVENHRTEECTLTGLSVANS